MILSSILAIRDTLVASGVQHQRVTLSEDGSTVLPLADSCTAYRRQSLGVASVCVSVHDNDDDCAYLAACLTPPNRDA